MNMCRFVSGFITGIKRLFALLPYQTYLQKEQDGNELDRKASYIVNCCNLECSDEPTVAMSFSSWPVPHTEQSKNRLCAVKLRTPIANCRGGQNDLAMLHDNKC